MTFNDEQMAVLAKYEQNFLTATKTNWSRYPGRDALEEILATLKAATGDRRRLNAACGVCYLNLLKDTGRLYFADKEARIAASNEKKAVELSEKKAVELSEKKAKPKKKVTVKTEK